MTLDVFPFIQPDDWMAGWTLFFWAWWVAWSAFIGLFLARISRGRTIREFCFGVLLIPAGLSTVWFAIFGGGAIGLQERAERAGQFDEDEQARGLGGGERGLPAGLGVPQPDRLCGEGAADVDRRAQGGDADPLGLGVDAIVEALVAQADAAIA